MAAVAAVVLGGALPALDASVDGRLPAGVAVLLFGGGPEAAGLCCRLLPGRWRLGPNVLGQLSALLCRLADRNPGPDLLADEAGNARVILVQPGFGDLLDLAVGQVRLYGRDSAESRDTS
ncbi:DUF2254 family protein [Arthrobacter sp. UYEF3]|uniref:DUF2254 family protein n=1 Tax=Arthrobacter sp. UYEF3 TaxID=1756365 RepID=UPI003392F790